MGRQIAEFLSILFGALVFIAGITAYVAQTNMITSSISYVKSNYANDAVYSESSIAVTNEDVISRDELIALLNGNPNKFIVIRDDVSGWAIKITSGMGINCEVEAAHGKNLQNSSTKINFYKDGWDPRKLDLDVWLQADSYQVKDIVDATGDVTYVLYYAS